MTKIAISAYKSAIILLDNNVPIERVKELLGTLTPPTAGYYYISDVMGLIETRKAA